MKRIVIKPITIAEYTFKFWGDCERIVKVFHEHDYSISLTEARTLWERYSDDYHAGWLCLPKEDVKIMESLQPYFEDEM